MESDLLLYGGNLEIQDGGWAKLTLNYEINAVQFLGSQTWVLQQIFSCMCLTSKNMDKIY